MPLPQEVLDLEKVDIAAGRCPECHVHLAGECSCGFLSAPGHAFCGACGKPLSGKPSPEGLKKHAESHWGSAEEAAKIAPDALRRWKMVTEYHAAG